MDGWPPDPDHRNLSLALRVGSLMLTGGASTDDVEDAMRRIARAAGLADVHAAVTMGIVTMSAVRVDDGQPITQLRIAERRSLDYQRLAGLAALVDGIAGGRQALGDAPRELARIEGLSSPYPVTILVLATALSSASATVLFGSSPMDALATLVIGLAVDPIVRRALRSGFPDFFQALLGPFLGAALAVALVAAGLPIDGGLVVVGGILRFLPGAGLVAGMRDLVDGSIISGSARLAEAILLGSAVAVGTALAIGIGTALGGPELAVAALEPSTAGILAQGIAAGFACAFFALSLRVAGRRELGAVFLLGGGAWTIAQLATSPDTGPLVPVVVAAVVVGLVGQSLAARARMPSVIWTVPAILPLLPGLTIVRGILGIGTLDGLLTVASAIGTGLALGAGVAFGATLVAVIRRAREAAQVVVQPVLDDVLTGRRGGGRVRPGSRSPSVAPDVEDGRGDRAD